MYTTKENGLPEETECSPEELMQVVCLSLERSCLVWRSSSEEHLMFLLHVSSVKSNYRLQEFQRSRYFHIDFLEICRFDQMLLAYGNHSCIDILEQTWILHVLSLTIEYKLKAMSLLLRQFSV